MSPLASSLIRGQAIRCHGVGGGDDGPGGGQAIRCHVVGGGDDGPGGARPSVVTALEEATIKWW